jgi:hypothetical protein
MIVAPQSLRNGVAGILWTIGSTRTHHTAHRDDGAIGLPIGQENAVAKSRYGRPAG